MCRNKAALVALIGSKGKSANAVSAHANLPLRAFLPHLIYQAAH